MKINETLDSTFSQSPTNMEPRQKSSPGLLIVNADDWGRDKEVTDRTLDCRVKGAVSSVSAMTFMEDSERAAALALEHQIDTGLHLNFTTPFLASNCPPKLVEQQQRLQRYLLSHRFAQIIYYPGLTGAFQYVVSSQLEEFYRLYGAAPERIDGHHHMHLCANVLLGELMPAGTLVRRNFSFLPGEKNWVNRFYRKSVDRLLKRRHRLVDYLFSLEPVGLPDRLQRIVSLARHAIVELETHPVNPDEYRFLTSSDIVNKLAGFPPSLRFCAVR